MKIPISVLVFLSFSLVVRAESTSSRPFNPPNLDRGLAVMQAFLRRASVKEFDSRKLDWQDLSDLIWAAYGVNRPAEGKRTAPSAYNAQDIELYVFLEEGVYFYEAREHVLHLFEPGDHRDLVSRGKKGLKEAPVFLVLVSDVSKFPQGTAAKKLEWGAISAGIVSQNISLFCAGTNMVTRPRAGMNAKLIRELLFLQDHQILLLNHGVSYAKPAGGE